MKLSWDVSNDGNPPPDTSDGSSQKYRVKPFIGSGGPITEPKRVRPLRVKLQSFKSGSYDIVEERQKTLAPIFKFKAGEKMKLASKHWRRIEDPKKNAWKDRATYLNFLTPSGVFVTSPSGIDEFESLALASLTAEVDVLRGLLRSVIRRKPRREVSLLFKKFGPEKFQLRTQSFCSLNISLLFLAVLFGNDFKKMRINEVVYRTKITIILHIHSIARFKEIFTVRDTPLSVVEDDGIEYSVSPKVFFRDAYGFSVDDDPTGRIRALTSDNLIIDSNHIFSCLSQLSYSFPKESDIIDYWPIRLKIQRTRVQMTFSRVAFSVPRHAQRRLLPGISS